MPTDTAAAPPPTLRLDLDLDALSANWRALDQMAGAECRTGAAVKANAYGLGVERVVLALHKAGAQDFYVAHWSEVAAVAAHVPAQAISVLHGPLTAEDCAYARATGARPVLNSMRQVCLWLESGGGACDLMVDTGMNRLGIAMDALGQPEIAQLQIDTVMSHLASADEDVAQNAAQQRNFLTVCAAVPAKRRSLSGSAGIALGQGYCFDLTRPGLSLYGGIPRAELAGVIRQVAWPEAAIIQVRELKPGDAVGYNATFIAERPMRVGVVSLGYADGYLRCWSGKGMLRHGEHLLPLLGRVSMDMVVVDLASCPDLAEGDWLEIPFGLPESSRQSGLSQYELLTVLGRRFVP
ncbi:MAG: alanine racemase [Caenibius sp.]